MQEPNSIRFERLADLAEGRLPAEESRRLREQLDGADEGSRDDYEWLQAFGVASSEAVIEAPPAEVRDELVRRFEGYAEGTRPPGLLRRITATLRFDGGAQPAFGVRSGGTSNGQFVYATGVADIALNVRSLSGGRLDLDGQVLPNSEEAEPGAFGVQLLTGGTEIETTATDEVGGFAFEALEPGTYEVSISGEGVEISILAVELRRP
jgi:hypothetical protein